MFLTPAKVMTKLDLACQVFIMLYLCSRRVSYSCGETIAEKLVEIKEYVTAPLGIQLFLLDWLTELYVDYSALGMDLASVQKIPRKEKMVWMDSTKLLRHKPGIYHIW